MSAAKKQIHSDQIRNSFLRTAKSNLVFEIKHDIVFSYWEGVSLFYYKFNSFIHK